MSAPEIRFLTGTIILLSTFSCSDPPLAEFSYEPSFNPEAGEEIVFMSEAEKADVFYWDFGNGEVSEEENPVMIFETPGDYTVSFSATNRFGSNTAEKTLIINLPTVLEIYFFTYDGVGISLAPVSLYDSYSDAVGGALPLFTAKTNPEGKVSFWNMDTRSFFVVMEKAELNGEYAVAGNVGPLIQNEVNTYYTYAEYYSYKKSGLEAVLSSPEKGSFTLINR